MNVLQEFPGALNVIESSMQQLGIASEDGAPLPIVPFSGAGGSYSDMHAIRLTDSTGAVCRSFIVKSIPDDEQKQTQAKELGLAREAFFFTTLGGEVAKVVRVPEVWYAKGDMLSGRKVVLMEELCYVTQSGYFFGPGSPLNHRKNLQEICDRAGNPTPKEVAAATIQAAAKLHAQFWLDESLLEFPWLRGSSWACGQSEEVWRTFQQAAVNHWNEFLEETEKGQNALQWSSEFVALVDASVKKVSWEAQKALRRPWTLVHGDLHPPNVMWCHGDSARAGSEVSDKVVFLDWELVGLGSGPQEIGRYMIAQMDPGIRKECEEELVRSYYDQLVSSFPEGKSCEYTWEECWHEYKHGGAERWMWFMAYFSTFGNQELGRFFLGQVEAFVRDHGITAESIGQPRP